MTPSQLALLMRSLSRIPALMGRVSEAEAPDQNDLLGKTGMRGLKGAHPAIQAFGAITVLAAGAAIAVFIHRLKQIDDDFDNETYTEVDEDTIIKDFLKKFELENVADKQEYTPSEEIENRELAKEALEELKDSKKAALPPAQPAGAPVRPAPAPTVTPSKNTVLSELKGKFDELKSALPSSVSSTQSSGGSLIGVGQSRKIYVPGSEVMNALREASSLSGVPLALLLSVAEAESFFSPTAGAKTSTAKGLMQFTDDTWQDAIRWYGKDPAVVARFGKNGLTADMKYDPLASAILGAYYMRDNLDRFKKKGYPTTSTEAYMNHFLGPSGAMKFMDNMKANPNSEAAPDFGDGRAKTPSGSNTNIFYAKGKDGKRVALTYAQVYEILKRKMNSQSFYQDLIDGKYGGLQTEESFVSQYGDNIGIKHLYRNKEGALFVGKAATVEQAREIREAKAAKKGVKTTPAPASANSKDSVPKGRPPATPKTTTPKSPPSTNTASTPISMPVASATPNLIRSPSGALFYG